MFHEVLYSCKRSNIAYQNSQKINNLYRPSIFYDGSHKRKNDAQGFLRQSRNKIYVTFRGTKNYMDMKDIIDIRHQSMIRPDIKVHSGFHDRFFEIEENITSDIEDMIASYKIDEIIFAGHSLGGAISLIAAPFYGQKFDKTIKAYSFGTVSVGNAKFIEWFTKNVHHYCRIENADDIVPRIPIHPTFVHVPRGISIDTVGRVKFAAAVKPTYGSLIRKTADTWKDIFEHHSCEKYQKNLYLSYRNYKVLWRELQKEVDSQ